MTEKEASKITAIMQCADGGCPWCVADQLQKFSAAFPKWKGLARKAWPKHKYIELPQFMKGPPSRQGRKL